MAKLKRTQKILLILHSIMGPWQVDSVSLDGILYRPKDYKKLEELLLQELATLQIEVNI